jgi:RimJ/RimL family protein N-acetyltransferase
VALLPDVLRAGPVELRRWRPAFADALIPVIALSFAELQLWMDWAQVMPAVEDLRSVLETGEAAFDTDQEWNYTVYEPVTDTLVGGAGLGRGVDPLALNIGYWTRSDRTGRGYATAAARALTEVAFTLIPDIQRVEIHMDKANAGSAAVPRKLGYRLDHEEVRQVEAPGHTGHGFVWVLDRPSPPRIS